MNRILLILQNLIWPAVIAGALSVATILTALLTPDRGNLILGLGLSAVAWACLAQTV